MVAHMKTTIDIADALLAEAKQVAAAERTTLRSLVEQGLREAIEKRRRNTGRFRLRNASVRGHGLQPGIREGDWEQIRDLIYEGRGA